MKMRMAAAGLLIVATACSTESNETSVPTEAAAPTTSTTAAPASGSTVPPSTAPVGQSRPLPNVIGSDLQLAQDTLQAAGFYALKSHDAKGLNRNQVLDRAWTVVDQNPPAGRMVPTNQVIDLGAVRDEEYQGG